MTDLVHALPLSGIAANPYVRHGSLAVLPRAASRPRNPRAGPGDDPRIPMAYRLASRPRDFVAWPWALWADQRVGPWQGRLSAETCFVSAPGYHDVSL